MGTQPFGVEFSTCLKIAEPIRTMRQSGIEVAVVIGGGNIFRGQELKKLGVPQSPADQMGMLGTMINGIALQQALELIGCKAKVMSAVDCPKLVDSYSWQHAKEALGNGTVVIFVAGTGNPYFTTDSAAALRASEIEADLLLKATKVDGVYDQDPISHPEATKYDTITYKKVLTDNLKVMDATAIALCRQSNIPIFVFNMKKLDSNQIIEALSNPSHGTLIGG